MRAGSSPRSSGDLPDSYSPMIVATSVERTRGATSATSGSSKWGSSASSQLSSISDVGIDERNEGRRHFRQTGVARCGRTAVVGQADRPPSCGGQCGLAAVVHDDHVAVVSDRAWLDVECRHHDGDIAGGEPSTRRGPDEWRQPRRADRSTCHDCPVAAASARSPRRLVVRLATGGRVAAVSRR